MEIVNRVLGPVQTNCYILMDQGHALIIDPGAPIQDLDAILDAHQCQLDAICLTHAHFDHIGGIPSILEKYPVDVYVHPKEVSFFADTKLNVSQAFMQPFSFACEPKALKEGKQTIGSFDLDVLYTPGHSVGSLCILYKDILFSGDTLFMGSIGRTDMVTGSYSEIIHSLEKLKALKLNYYVLPGHGPQSSLDDEKQWNSYMR